MSQALNDGDSSTANDGHGSDGSATGASAGTTAETLQFGWGLLSQRERSALWGLGIVMAVNAGLQTASVLAIFPVLKLVLDPAGIESSRWLAGLYRLTGSVPIGQFGGLLGLGCLFLILLAVVSNLATARLIRHWIVVRQTRLAADLLPRCLSAPYIWHLQRNATRLSRFLCDDVRFWARGFVQRALTIVGEVLTILVALVAVVFFSGWLTIAVAMALGAVALFGTRAIKPVIARLSQKKRLGQQESLVMATQAFQGIRDVILSSSANHFSSAFTRPYEASARANASIQIWMMLPSSLLRAIAQSGLIVFVLGLWWLGVGFEEASKLSLALYLVVSKVVPSLALIAVSVSSIVISFPHVEAIREVENSLNSLPNKIPEGGREVSPDWRRLTLERVSFAYEGTGKLALEEVDLAFERGCMYGVVGKSAAGKSTLVDILSGLLQPTEGQVCIGELDLVDASLASYHARLSYVSQSPYLLDDTIRANVTFGADEIDEELLNAALEQAQLSEWVASLPHGLDTPMGDHGVSLSGGQRQRVVIARALYRKPDILILDEATSALDALTEQQIVEGLLCLKGEVTVIIVTHRLRTVSCCDEIVLLEAGEVAAQGSYATLVQESELFHSLVTAGRETPPSPRCA